MKLVRPSILYKDSFSAAAKEIIAEGHNEFLKTKYDEENFVEYCDALNNLARGIGLAPGNISETIFWLIDEQEDFVGSVSIRHELTEHLFTFGGHIGGVIAPGYRSKGYGTKLLTLGLTEARNLGLKKVLITCDKTNTASAKVIEKNGGVFENELYSEQRKVWKRRYWIDLD